MLDEILFGKNWFYLSNYERVRRLKKAYAVLTICFIFMTSLFFVSNFGAIRDGMKMLKSESASINITNEDIVKECKNKSLGDTAECLTAHTMKFFKYTETDDKIDLTFEQLKSYGGDCKDWSDFYISVLSELGFHSKYVDMPIDQFVGHRFVVFSNEEGYVILDQLRYEVHELG